jgi:hypothetical protein
MILPADTVLFSIPSTGWHLCCRLATPSAPTSPSLRQDGGFGIPPKQTLQAYYRRF